MSPLGQHELLLGHGAVHRVSMSVGRIDLLTIFYRIRTDGDNRTPRTDLVLLDAIEYDTGDGNNDVRKE